jgi:hypothetical protein
VTDGGDARLGQCSGMTPDERFLSDAAKPKIDACKSWPFAPNVPCSYREGVTLHAPSIWHYGLIDDYWRSSIPTRLKSTSTSGTCEVPSWMRAAEPGGSSPHCTIEASTSMDATCPPT